MSVELERLKGRANVVRAVRRFFDEQGFVEVDTPVLQTTLAPEPHIEAPASELCVDGHSVVRFLQTSPELLMKRLLARGVSPIYQIAPCFRDGDFTAIHRPEFRLLEWYRSGSSWTRLMEDCEQLLFAVANETLGATRITYGGRTIDLTPPFRRVSMEEAFFEHAGFSILGAQDRNVLAEELSRVGVHHGTDDSWDDLFNRVFLSRVEPALTATGQPFFLTHYPAPLASLARLCDDTPGTAERFELYVGGLELANGFGELTDAVVQRRRFEEDAARRAAQKMRTYPAAETFLHELERLPPCAGIALGMERLLMLVLDAQDIDEVTCLPWGET